MIFNFFSRYYPIILFKKTPKTLQKDQKTKTSNLNFTNTISPDQSKVYSEGKDPKRTGKEEELQVKMPGFIPPDSMNDEGYFTQKAKQQLEELKRRGLEKPTLNPPDKKE